MKRESLMNDSEKYKILDTVIIIGILMVTLIERIRKIYE